MLFWGKCKPGAKLHFFNNMIEKKVAECRCIMIHDNEKKCVHFSSKIVIEVHLCHVVSFHQHTLLRLQYSLKELNFNLTGSQNRGNQ